MKSGKKKKKKKKKKGKKNKKTTKKSTLLSTLKVSTEIITTGPNRQTVTETTLVPTQPTHMATSTNKMINLTTKSKKKGKNKKKGKKKKKKGKKGKKTSISVLATTPTRTIQQSVTQQSISASLRSTPTDTDRQRTTQKSTTSSFFINPTRHTRQTTTQESITSFMSFTPTVKDQQRTTQKSTTSSILINSTRKTQPSTAQESTTSLTPSPMHQQHTTQNVTTKTILIVPTRKSQLTTTQKSTTSSMLIFPTNKTLQHPTHEHTTSSWLITPTLKTQKPTTQDSITSSKLNITSSTTIPMGTFNFSDRVTTKGISYTWKPSSTMSTLSKVSKSHQKSSMYTIRPGKGKDKYNTTGLVTSTVNKQTKTLSTPNSSTKQSTVSKITEVPTRSYSTTLFSKIRTNTPISSTTKSSMSFSVDKTRPVFSTHVRTTTTESSFSKGETDITTVTDKPWTKTTKSISKSLATTTIFPPSIAFQTITKSSNSVSNFTGTMESNSPSIKSRKNVSTKVMPPMKNESLPTSLPSTRYRNMQSSSRTSHLTTKRTPIVNAEPGMFYLHGKYTPIQTSLPLCTSSRNFSTWNLDKEAILLYLGFCTKDFWSYALSVLDYLTISTLYKHQLHCDILKSNVKKIIKRNKKSHFCQLILRI